MREQRVDRFLVAVHDVEHAVGQARLPGAARPCGSPASDRVSEGFSTNVLPQASATGNIHSGTIAGKLNGVMPAHTPTGCRSEIAVHVGADVFAELALEQVRDAGGELDHLDAARDLALGVGQRLAVFLRDDLREILALRVHEIAEAHEDARAAQRRIRAPECQRGGGGRDGRVHVGGIAERHVADHLARGRIGDLAVARRSARRPACRRSTAAAVRESSGPWRFPQCDGGAASGAPPSCSRAT